MKLTTIPSLTSRRQNRSRNSLLSENDTVGSMNSCTCVHVAVNCIVTTTFTCITVKLHVHVECCGFESHPKQLIFLRKSDCLGCAVLLCLVVCLTLLASFFLPSHLSLNTCTVYLRTHIFAMESSNDKVP